MSNCVYGSMIALYNYTWYNILVIIMIMWVMFTGVCAGPWPIMYIGCGGEDRTVP